MMVTDSQILSRLRQAKGLQGFSLVELMVTMSIMGVLVTVSMPKFQDLKSRAKQTEAKMNVRTLSALATSYYSENSPVGGYSEGNVSLNNFSTSTSCNTPNVLGFSLTDCRQINYVYFVYPGYTGGSYQPSVSAFEGKNTDNTRRVYSRCTYNIDVWSSSGSSLFHTGDPEKACSLCYVTSLLAAWGTANPLYDLSGNGTVDSTDINIISAMSSISSHLACL